jgi:hypothetical protein
VVCDKEKTLQRCRKKDREFKKKKNNNKKTSQTTLLNVKQRKRDKKQPVL